MVKGISRQMILVQSPDPKLFEQAIFILKEDAAEITDEQLLKEADRIIRSSGSTGYSRRFLHFGPAWAALGAALTGAVWLITACVF